MAIDKETWRELTAQSESPRLIELTDEDADPVFGALSSDTARHILGLLYDTPRTMSEVADELDTSVQNVDYHIQKLRDAELVQVVDTTYADNFREMNVWGPTATSLAIVGSRSPTEYVKDQLQLLFGVAIALGLGAMSLYLLLTIVFQTAQTSNGESDSNEFLSGDIVDSGDIILDPAPGTTESGFLEGVFAFIQDPVIIFLLGGLLILLLSVIALEIFPREPNPRT